MYPYRTLPENLVAFSARLRRQHQFQIGPRELQDAARALLATQLGDERAVRDVLRPVLCSRAADAAVFDRAFADFFHPGAATHLETLGQDRGVDRSSTHNQPQGHESSESDQTGLDLAEDAANEAVRLPRDLRDTADESAGLLRSSYSPSHGGASAPELTPADAAWRAAASAFVMKLRLGLSRRWWPARRGQRFDLRRTLRHGLHTGGDPVTPRWQARPRRRPRIVVLIDGSRSMSTHVQVALEMAVALTSVTLQVETFSFSTTLHRVTRDVRLAAAGAVVRLGRLHHAWGGGTAIGACLHDFVKRFGERLLSADTVIVISSDGLDVGDPRVLRDAMAALRRRSSGVIWLNPLLDTPGYEPTALGMSVARPYLSMLACVNDPASLLRLARHLRL